MLRVTAFGSIQLFVHGQPIRLKPDQAFVIALLVAAGRDGLTRSELYVNLYGEDHQKSGKQAAVMRVRRLRDRLERDHSLGSAIKVQDRFGLNPELCEVDVWNFHEHQTSSDPDLLLEVVRQWGEPFAGLTGESDLLIASRNELQKNYAQALIRLGWMVEPGFGLEAVSWLENLIADDPFNEHLVASTAGALYRLGQQTAGTRLISECRSRLREEFGLNAGLHLDEIELALLNQDNERLASRRPSAGRPATVDTLTTALSEPPRFVGRAGLLTSLTQEIRQLQRPSSRPGQIHLLTGGAGVGKTTFLLKLLSGIGPDDFEIRVGRVRTFEPSDLADAPARREETYGLIIDALPELRPALDALNKSVDTESGRIRFWQKAHAFLQELAASRPTVVTFEDVHDADSQSVALIRHLIAAARPSSLMIIMSARPQVLERGDRADEMAAIVESENVNTITLGPITQQDLRELVALDHPAEATVARERFVQRLWDLSQGHSMVASILSRDAPPGLDPMRLPDSLEWEGALASLLLEKSKDPEVRQLLSVAALLAGTGLEFRQDVLAEILGSSEEVIADLLGQARKEDICFHLGEGLWAFDHLLTIGLFDQQLGVLRQLLCSQLAGQPYISSLDRVRYTLGAGNLIPAAQAITILLADARELVGRLAFREAISALDEVLSLVGKPVAGAADLDDVARQRLDVLMMLAACHARTGNFPAAVAHRGDAFALARRLGDTVGMLDAALAGLPSGEYVGGDIDRLEMLQQIDLDDLPADRHPDFLYWQLRLARLSDQFDLAQEIASSIDLSQVGKDQSARSGLGQSLLSLRQMSTGEFVHDELLGLATELPDGPERAGILLRAAIAALAEQRSDAVSDTLLRAATEVRLHGLPRYHWSIDVLTAALNAVGMRGPVGSSADPESARLSGLRWGIPDVYDAWGVQIWAGRWFGGDFEGALALLDAGETSTVVNEGWKAAEALAAANVGDISRALRCAELVREKLTSKPVGNWTAAAAALLIEAAVALDSPELAAAGESRLAHLSGQAVVLGVGSAYLGPVDRYLGQAAGLRDPRVAIDLLSKARDQAERTGATFWRDRAAADLHQLTGETGGS